MDVVSSRIRAGVLPTRHKEGSMRRPILLALAVAVALPAGAAGSERLTDEQVRKLIEDIDGGYKTWKQELERGNLDDAVLTSAERTIKVKDFLKDFDKEIDILKSRFKPNYAASLEVLALLRRGSDVVLHNRRVGRTPTSSWTVLEPKLEALAGAYELGWPVQSMSVQAVRLNDIELAGKVQQVEQAAKQLRGESEKAAKTNKSIDKATRESLKTSIQQLEQKAKDVTSRIKDDRPAKVEVGQLLSQAGSLKQTLTQLQLPSAEGPAWKGIDAGTEALARAYGMKK
jgi:hypothetical protein